MNDDIYISWRFYGAFHETVYYSYRLSRLYRCILSALVNSLLRFGEEQEASLDIALDMYLKMQKKTRHRVYYMHLSHPIS